MTSEKSKKKVAPVTLDSLSEAQEYVLYRSIEQHHLKIGKGHKDQNRKSVALFFAAGSTAMALDRKGLIESDKTRIWSHGWILTPSGRRLGVEAFERIQGRSPESMAQEMIDERLKKRKKADDERREVANLFSGLTVVTEKRRRPLDKVLLERMGESSGTASFTLRELRSIGKQLSSLTSKKRTGS